MRKSSKRYAVIIAVFIFTMVSGFSLFANAEDFCPHQYSVIDHEDPTEDTDGYTIYRCELCGDEYTVTLFAAGHDWGGWIVTKEPTETEPGMRYRTCSRGLTHTEWAEIPPLGVAQIPEIISETGQVFPESVAREQDPRIDSYHVADIAAASVAGGIGLVYLLMTLRVAIESNIIFRHHRMTKIKNQSECLRRYKRGKSIWKKPL